MNKNKTNNKNTLTAKIVGILLILAVLATTITAMIVNCNATNVTVAAPVVATQSTEEKTENNLEKIAGAVITKAVEAKKAEDAGMFVPIAYFEGGATVILGHTVTGELRALNYEYYNKNTDEYVCQIIRADQIQTDYVNTCDSCKLIGFASNMSFVIYYDIDSGSVFAKNFGDDNSTVKVLNFDGTQVVYSQPIQ